MNTFHVPLSAMRLLLSLFLVALLAGCDASAPASDALAVRFLVDGQANVTYQAADDVSTARADGRWETRLTAGPDDVLALDAVSTDGQPVTTTIEIDGRVVAMHQGLRARSDSRPSERSQNEVEVKGAIEALSADRVRVQGRVFRIDASTRFLGGDNEPISFETFAIGTVVEAEGHLQSDGTVRAKKLKLEDLDDDAGDEHEVEVEGTIDAVSPTSITVSGTVFATTAATRWLDDDNLPISRDAFAPGLRAEAEGWVRDGVLTAEKVKLDED